MFEDQLVKKTPPVLNRKMLQPRLDPGGEYALRAYDRAPRGIMAARRLIKCGCCDQSVEIYHCEESIEINGVNGSIENWRELLLPLLGIKS